MGRAGRPRKDLPKHLIVNVPDSVLKLPQKQFVHMRCQSKSGAVCARCIRPIRRPTALAHINKGTLRIVLRMDAARMRAASKFLIA